MPPPLANEKPRSGACRYGPGQLPQIAGSTASPRCYEPGVLLCQPTAEGQASSVSKSAKHLDAYLDELEYRFNNRDNPWLFRNTLFNLINNIDVEYAKLTGAAVLLFVPMTERVCSHQSLGRQSRGTEY